MHTENVTLSLESGEPLLVDDLLKLEKATFNVPSYQRGYRWRAQVEVKNFLDKIIANKGQRECLQPLVLKKQGQENTYNVVDGQQRLTTIFIILKSCSDAAPTNRPNIIYETRKCSIESLDDEKETNNIDYFYMKEAFEHCKKVLANKDKKDIVEKLKQNFYFICHMLDDDEDEFEVFTRNNSGKIQLTNAELVKAMLLVGETNEGRVFEICHEWDEMARFFNNDDFWYFICPNPESEKYTQSRMDYLMELVAYNDKEQESKEKNASFLRLKQFMETADSNKVLIWRKLQRYYRTLKFWHDDSPGSRLWDSPLSFYHLIGYKTVTQRNAEEHLQFLHDLLDSEKDRIEKYRRLKDSIFGEFGDTADKALMNIMQYTYPDGSKKMIAKMLLLMNILTLEGCDSMNTRYPFAKHVKEEWSLEHIHARNEKFSEDLLKRYLQLIDAGKAAEIAGKTQEEQFQECIRFFEIPNKNYGAIQNSIFSYDSDIGNLALLPKAFNSMLNARPFCQKRELIQKECREKNVIIPICTLYAFFKYYSPEDTNNIVWTADNAIDYTMAGLELIRKFYND